MLDRGLIEEFLDFYREYNYVLEKKDVDIKYIEGIF